MFIANTLYEKRANLAVLYKAADDRVRYTKLLDYIYKQNSQKHFSVICSYFTSGIVILALFRINKNTTD